MKRTSGASRVKKPTRCGCDSPDVFVMAGCIIRIKRRDKMAGGRQQVVRCRGTIKADSMDVRRRSREDDESDACTTSARSSRIGGCEMGCTWE